MPCKAHRWDYYWNWNNMSSGFTLHINERLRKVRKEEGFIFHLWFQKFGDLFHFFSKVSQKPQKTFSKPVCWTTLKDNPKCLNLKCLLGVLPFKRTMNWQLTQANTCPYHLKGRIICSWMLNLNACTVEELATWNEPGTQWY